MLRNIAWYYMAHIDKYTVSFGIVCYSMGLHGIVWYRMVFYDIVYMTCMVLCKVKISKTCFSAGYKVAHFSVKSSF